MNDIDKSIVALALYVVFAAFFSLGYSHFQGKKTGKESGNDTQVSSQSVVQGKNKKKVKVIPDGCEAYCNVCSRSFDNDTYWKNHLKGQKHLKKAEKFKGEIYRIQKTEKGK